MHQHRGHAGAPRPIPGGPHCATPRRRGLQPGGPGCQANVAVFVTGNSDTFARQFFEHDRNRFRLSAS
ncbi:MAG: hypothetical protein IPL62_07145 [Caulobacteraceae bacterium]|nr:hypothetical protein [Caulobacteraceae bacterium]